MTYPPQGSGGNEEQPNYGGYGNPPQQGGSGGYGQMPPPPESGGGYGGGGYGGGQQPPPGGPGYGGPMPPPGGPGYGGPGYGGYGGAPQPSKTPLVLSIIGIVCWFLCSPAAIVLGFVAQSQFRNSGQSDTLAKVAWIGGIIALVLGIIIEVAAHS